MPNKTVFKVKPLVSLVFLNAVQCSCNTLIHSVIQFKRRKMVWVELAVNIGLPCT